MVGGGTRAPKLRVLIVESDLLRVNISNLRGNIEREPARPQFILNESGVGQQDASVDDRPTAPLQLDGHAPLAVTRTSKPPAPAYDAGPISGQPRVIVDYAVCKFTYPSGARLTWPTGSTSTSSYSCVPRPNASPYSMTL